MSFEDALYRIILVQVIYLLATKAMVEHLEYENSLSLVVKRACVICQNLCKRIQKYVVMQLLICTVRYLTDFTLTQSRLFDNCVEK